VPDKQFLKFTCGLALVLALPLAIQASSTITVNYQVCAAVSATCVSTNPAAASQQWSHGYSNAVAGVTFGSVFGHVDASISTPAVPAGEQPYWLEQTGFAATELMLDGFQVTGPWDSLAPLSTIQVGLSVQITGGGYVDSSSADGSGSRADVYMQVLLYNEWAGAGSAGRTFESIAYSGNACSNPSGCISGFLAPGIYPVGSITLHQNDQFGVDLQMWPLRVTADARSGNSASGLSDYTLSFLVDQPVFDLPPGFTVNADSYLGHIVNN